MTTDQQARVIRTLTECAVHIRAAREELVQYRKESRQIDEGVAERRIKHAQHAQR